MVRIASSMRIAMLVCLSLGTASRADGPNLIRNGEFSALSDNDRPTGWGVKFEGVGVEGEVTMVEGPEGKAAIRIECTAFPEKEKLAWVILKQDGTVPTRKGQKLYVSFWLRQERMSEGAVDLAIMRIKPWGTLAKAKVPISPEWRKAEMIIAPDSRQEDCDNTRFELYFSTTGTLYVSDIHVAETTKDNVLVNRIRLEMLRSTEPANELNVLRNSSFEVGISGWGTASFDHNVIAIDGNESHHGKASARIDLNRAILPSGFADYPKPRQVSFDNVKLATKGWTRFRQGKPYTLSAFLKSDRAGRQASLGVSFMTRERRLQSITVGTDWQRHVLSFAAPDAFGFVEFTSATEEGVSALWVDAVQLQEGEAETAYASRYPVEVAIHPRRPHGIYHVGEEVWLAWDPWFRDLDAKADLALTVTDHRKQVVHKSTHPLTPLFPGGAMINSTTRNGRYTATAKVSGEGFEYSATTPFAIVFPYADTYGNQGARFGTNHPFYSDLLQQIARDAGVYWVRDWTLKWDNVEPEQGKWDFSGPELFFERARRLNLHVQAILPDPSSGWASTGSPDTRGKRLGDAYEDLWHLPCSMEAYRAYARECISRYKGITTAWEVLNEPFAYKCREWKTEDTYDQFLTIVQEESARIDPKLQTMRCGLHYLSHSEPANAHNARIADILSEHVYPQYNNTRKFIGHVTEIADFQKRHQAERPIWFTEYGKYANDAPNFRHADFAHFLANGDEHTSTAYNVKYLTVLLGHGVEKVFFHQRTWPLGLNLPSHRIHFDMFFDYGPTPHTFFVAANAMSWLLPPGTEPGYPVNEIGPVFAYSFQRPQDEVLVAWTDGRPFSVPAPVRNLIDNVTVKDMLGGSLDELSEFGDDPVYLIGTPDSVGRLRKSLAPPGIGGDRP